MIIRKLRLDKGYSQEQLAALAGISTRTLQRIERGAKASPESLKCLAAVLETDFSELREANPMHNNNESILPELEREEREAMEYVRDIRGFYVHAIQYLVVIGGLFILNLITSPGYFWAIWPALGWGIGLVAHGLSVFEFIDIFGPEWEKQQIERRLNRNKQKFGRQ